MKTLKFYLCVLFYFIAVSVFSQSDSVYEKAMEANLLKLDSAKTVKEFQQCRNQFERIALKYNDKWIVAYYIIYADIQMVFSNPKGTENKSILDDANKRLTDLERMSGVDKSEVNTLWGYYYNAVIMLDPQTNGQKYFSQVMSNYNKAIEQNAQNPRPVFLLAFFEENLPSFLQSGKDFCKETQRAKMLYGNEIKSIDKPYWGRGFLESISAKCN